MLKSHIRFRTAAAIAGLAVGMACSTTALAQDADNRAAAGQRDGRRVQSIGEIVVTAQKREQKLQDVPVSITAVTGEKMEDLKVTDLRSIQSYVPNMAVLNSGVNPVVFIRGFGSGPNNVAFDQEVSVYLDGIYGGRGAQFSAPFFDLERMEVLRGPQGALFGRNTAAGAISLISARPGSRLEGYLSAGYDFERDGFDLTGVVSAPLSESFGIRVAGKMTRQDGYIRNDFNGRKEPLLRDEMARVTLRYNPSNDIDVTFKNEYGRHLLKGGVTVSGSLTENIYDNDFGSRRYVSDNYAGAGLEEHSGIKTWNSALNGDFGIGDHVLTVVGGYSHFKTMRFTAYDEYSAEGVVPPAAANAKFANGFPEKFDQWSVEARIASPLRQFFEYVAGVYYDHSDYKLHQDTYYRDIGTLAGHQSTDFHQKGDSWSAFGQGTLNFTPTFRLIAGLRYSRTKKSADFTQYTVSGSALNVIGPDRSGKLNEHYLDPSGTLQYDLTPAVKIYATIARGSKSGGFTSNTYNVAADGFQFAEERSTNYEAGVKSRIADGLATINLSIFRMDFDNLQQSAYDPDRRTFFTRNAAKARSEGAELEVQFIPTGGLSLNANAAYLKARFIDYPGAPCLAYETVAQCDSANPASLAAHNVAGLPLQFAPKWSGNLGFQHEADLGGMKLTTGGNAQFRSKYFIADGYSPIWGLQKGWTKFDARIALSSPDDRWTIALVGRNLTDVHTRGAAIRFPASITGTARSINWMDEYRSVSINGTYRF
ncbi:TonB-dependent receptor [Sphingobium jiangsuense]|uniref:Iron complex outermembrane receptor protein n=1 Tax=Sphingobium jiangsuense TaxID=870476 RepID=A0A7W6FRC1_9SPHN|nr:TonB-dependent receptor [Sphingobium jiangsuense]MBB3926879.1 iron complex outermembrane receptor protein [Sphingobium jiangsuense]GLS98887.1 TonB-dependent receptor [Sphingobium jiangsuense]